jgi:glycosyltransferase involved in cell wall biosynthesis
MLNDTVCILMATFNGEKYVRKQLESIINQTFENWKLFIRDDGSSDKTVKIIEEFCKKFHEKFFLISNKNKHFGLKESYNQLLSLVQSSYYMFSDQDDWWLPDKIEITYKRMKILEKEFGSGVPILIHTDLAVADEKLEIISKSFSKFQNLKAWKIKSFNRLLVQNVVSGCTVMINRKLRDLALPIPLEALMHDWWLGLVASAFGIVDYINCPTILYRQHGVNVVGAKEWNINLMIRSLMKLREKAESITNTITQARYFFQRYQDKLNERDYEIARAFSIIKNDSFINKRLKLIRYRLFKAGIVRNIGMFFGI